MRTHRLTAGLMLASCTALGIACIPFAPGGPQDSCEPLGITSTDELLMGGNADRLIFERRDHALCSCGGWPFQEDLINLSVVAVDPATFAVTDLSITSEIDRSDVFQPISTDGEWIALEAADGITVYDIGTGISSLVCPASSDLHMIEDPHMTAHMVDRPYVLLQSSYRDRVLNAETGEIQDPSSTDSMFARLTSVSNRRAAYVETDLQLSPTAGPPVAGRLMLLDLDSGNRVFLADVENVIRLYLLHDRVCWIEGFGPPRSQRLLKVCDLASGAISTLVEEPPSGTSPAFAVVSAIDAGVLVYRERHGATPDSLEFTGFDGQTRVIDTASQEGRLYTWDIRPVDPFVVYRRAGIWTIFDTRDNTRRQIGPSATSQPSP